MERAELNALVQATGRAVTRGPAVFLCDPAASAAEQEQARILMAETGDAGDGSGRGWLGVRTGGSGGGVLTAWTIARTDRFRAAASYYPVIEWTSLALTTDTIADGVMTRSFPGAPWEVPEDYRARSLLTPVANVKTPTILIVGAEDYRTPDHQAEQYYRALKYLGVEAAFVRVPDEGHGINHHPSHKLSKVLHTIGWLEKHK